MNRSTFEAVPKILTNRTKIDLSKPLLGTINSGRFTPIYYHDVIPGDTWEERMSGIFRCMTSKYPTLTPAYLDMIVAWVPMRQEEETTKEFFGENTKAPWALEDRPTKRKILTPDGGWNVGTLADTLAYPVNVQITKPIMNRDIINGVCMVWNEYERNENLQYPIEIPDNSILNVKGKNADYTDKSAYVTTSGYGGNIPPACKLKDYFTETLPAPQKSAEGATFNLLQDIPVNIGDAHSTISKGTVMTFNKTVDNTQYEGTASLMLNDGYLTPVKTTLPETDGYIKPNNLWAYAEDTPAVSIAQLRNAILTQHLAEIQARSGTRYHEILSVQYHVDDPQAKVLQIPEIITTKRTRLNMQQVVQTSGTTGTGEDMSPLGETGGLGRTESNDFVHYTASETEFGHIIIFAVIRPQHIYAQGIRRTLLNTKYEDYYNPVLEGKSEQPVYSVEIFAEDIEPTAKIFGYQEPWAELRFEHAQATGLMRPNVAKSLGLYWSFADNYSKAPTLSNEWIQEDPANIGRTLVLPDEEQYMYIIQDHVSVTRNISPYGIPGIGTI